MGHARLVQATIKRPADLAVLFLTPLPIGKFIKGSPHISRDGFCLLRRGSLALQQPIHRKRLGGNVPFGLFFAGGVDFAHQFL